MCHEVYFTRERLEAALARERTAEPDAEESVETEAVPAFLNEERETDVEILTDGGTN